VTTVVLVLVLVHKFEVNLDLEHNFTKVFLLSLTPVVVTKQLPDVPLHIAAQPPPCRHAVVSHCRWPCSCSVRVRSWCCLMGGWLTCGQWTRGGWWRPHDLDV
jgi:hypothetical protein